MVSQKGQNGQSKATINRPDENEKYFYSLSVKQLLTATDGRIINHMFFTRCPGSLEVSYLQLLHRCTVSAVVDSLPWLNFQLSCPLLPHTVCPSIFWGKCCPVEIESLLDLCPPPSPTHPPVHSLHFNYSAIQPSSSLSNVTFAWHCAVSIALHTG